MRLPLLVLLFLIPPMSLVAGGRSQQEIKELIKEAEAKTNIFDLSSFEMKAAIRSDNYGKPLDGSYLLFWNGPERWREEINFPGYSEIRVGGKGTVFVKRTTDFVPLAIYQLHSLFGYGTLGYGTGTPSSFFHIAPGQNETIKKIRGEKINGVKVECTEILDPYKFTRDVCVDLDTGTIVRQQPFVDREMMAVGAKFFPRFLSYVENGKTLAEAHITELKTAPEFPLSAFEPPPGAISQPGCMNPAPAHLLNRVAPHYPDQEKQSRVQGTVAIDTLIGNDGVPRQFRIVSNSTPGLNNASLDAVRQWRWEPATCNGVAVEIEVVIKVNYQLN